MRDEGIITFGGSGLDRAAELRGDPAAIAALAADPAARAMVMWQGKPLTGNPDLAGDGTGPAALAWIGLGHPALEDARSAPILLGRDDDGTPLFAAELDAWEPPDLDAAALGAFADPSEQWHPELTGTGSFVELRRVMTTLSARDAELAATARALFGWHRSHGFCARCGARSEVAQGGWQRLCPACGAHHFPRTDPVVIMLVTRGNRALLGRSPGWPEGMYSCLAGFVEPGETIEAAVRREVHEEVGVRVGPVDYLASQPWPFPASLMIGCHGIAESDEIVRDPAEIEHALWIEREDLAAAFAGDHPTVSPARPGAIARALLRNWLADRRY
ncbi:NAD(+) diphosphatase [Roseivivax marinus]|uniref:NAD(+) diphosphatase n=1 Tax=Roseivivax marinus TaxID=1379903 RepID=UPI00273DB700|nr:NAD(+) diphosphatase [Roseivivax marinus]